MLGITVVIYREKSTMQNYCSALTHTVIRRKFPTEFFANDFVVSAVILVFNPTANSFSHECYCIKQNKCSPSSHQAR